MRSQRDYYEILGLSSTATSADIKKRYRELARKFHPDVAKDKAVSHRAFSQITEAYQTLSDPDKRRSYDASRTPPASSSRPSAGPGSSRTYESRPSSGQASRPTPPPTGRPLDPGQLVKEAEFAFIRGRMSEAMGLCRQAIRQNRANARAHAILADIYRIQGKKEQAILEYGYAVQFDPSDRGSQEKLEKLLATEHRQHRQSEAQRIRRDVRDEYFAERQSAAQVAHIVGWGICFFLLFLINVYQGTPIPWLAVYAPPVSTWSWNLIGLLAIDGALVGFLLAVNKLIEHPDDELLFQYLPGAMIPIGVPLVICSLVWFYAAAAGTLLINYLQGSNLKSLARIFGSVTFLTLAAALIYEPGRAQVALYGGNIVFPAAVIGWYLGSVIAPIEK